MLEVLKVFFVMTFGPLLYNGPAPCLQSLFEKNSAIVCDGYVSRSVVSGFEL